jgi:hypothetical protein
MVKRRENTAFGTGSRASRNRGEAEWGGRGEDRRRLVPWYWVLPNKYHFNGENYESQQLVVIHNKQEDAKNVKTLSNCMTSTEYVLGTGANCDTFERGKQKKNTENEDVLTHAEEGASNLTQVSSENELQRWGIMYAMMSGARVWWCFRIFTHLPLRVGSTTTFGGEFLL